MLYYLENDTLKIAVSTHGAELSSIFNKTEGKELLWQGNPDFWGRKSPVLFPVVGKYRNGKTTFKGSEYKSGQHGFARDNEFALVEGTASRLCFELCHSDESLKQYPFKFRLLCSFELEGNTVTVGWAVENTDSQKIYFSIGAHPAFYCEKGKTQLSMNGKGLEYSLINAEGLYTAPKYNIESTFTLNDSVFDKDALIIENSGVTQVALVDNGVSYLTVEFDAPLFGIWSPAKKNAPFVCIEPWFGRCDAEDFEGDITKRQWGNCLEIGEKWHKEYKIKVNG